MKVPKYIEEAIMRRSRAADRLCHYDYIVSRFIEEHGIDCDLTHLHAEVICNSSLSAGRTLRAIENHQG